MNYRHLLCTIMSANFVSYLALVTGKVNLNSAIKELSCKTNANGVTKIFCKGLLVLCYDY